MARQKGSRTGRCQGCNHLERVRIERLLSAVRVEVGAPPALSRCDDAPADKADPRIVGQGRP